MSAPAGPCAGDCWIPSVERRPGNRRILDAIWARVVARGPWRDETDDMDRNDGVATARALVARRFPDAVQAWLSGSVVLGGSTPTSDLDITVLLDRGDPHREALMFEQWPVELFVHTE